MASSADQVFLFYRPGEKDVVEKCKAKHKDRSLVVGEFDAVSESTDSNSFHVKRYYKHLREVDNPVFGSPLFYAHSIDSTQTRMQNNIDGYPVGSAFVVDIQTAGRGRGENTWSSPTGSLSFSFKCEVNEGSQLPFLQYVVSMALVSAIRTKPGLETADLKLKWPNDIYHNHQKVAGVLCNSVYSNSKFNVIIGVGINVNNTEPASCIRDAIAKVSVDDSTSREELLARFFASFDKYFQTFLAEGFGSLRPLYLDYWLHTDEEVRVEDEQGTSEHVRITGITSSGFLEAKTPEGRVIELHPDGNRFDFFRHLLTKKL